MTVSEFFRRYANVPLKLRFVPISFNKGGDATLSDVHKEMIALEEQMRPLKIRQEKLLNLAEIVLKRIS